VKNYAVPPIYTVRSRWHYQDCQANAGRRKGERMQYWKLIAEFAKADQGQDLIEYALMAGFVAVAAGALMPNVSSSISTVFSKISSLLANAAG